MSSESLDDAEAATLAAADALQALDDIRAIDTLWQLSEHAIALAKSGDASSEVDGG